MLTLTVLAGLAACGGGDGMTTPTGPATITLQLDFGSIHVVEDCDGIEGDGDFEFTVETYASTADDPQILFHKSVALGPGGLAGYIGRYSYSFDADKNGQRTVRFTATEYDKSVFGATYADSRLDHATAFVTYQYTNGTWNTLGETSIALGSDGCRVRLGWSASVEKG